MTAPMARTQVTFAKYALPEVIGNATHPGGDAYVNVTMLSNDLFPNWCGGQCGCEADAKRGALKFLRHENLKGHLTTGRRVPEWDSCAA